MARTKKSKQPDTIHEAEQEEFDAPGMEPVRVFNASVDPKAREFCKAERQIKLWKDIRNRAKPLLMDAMKEEGLDLYILKNGDKVKRSDLGAKLTVTFAKDEDDKADVGEPSLIEE